MMGVLICSLVVSFQNSTEVRKEKKRKGRIKKGKLRKEN